MRAPSYLPLIAIPALGFLVACSSLLDVEGPMLEYMADELRVVEREDDGSPYPIAYLRAGVGVVNRSADSVSIDFGDCALRLEAHRPDGGAEPVWDSRHRGGWPYGTMYGCLAYLAGRTLGPGDTLRADEFGERIPLADILADSLPAGEYRFVATLTTGDETARVALGRVELPESMHPLPEWEAPRDGFYYRVGVEREPGADTAVATLDVSFTAPRSHSLERSLSRDCPLRILAFEAADSRETVPVPEPAWAWPASCGADVDTVRLGPGESTRFELDVPVDELLASGVAPGRYFLLAAVRPDGRPIHMKVGELELPDLD